MPGSNAALHRIFRAKERLPVSAERSEALAALAAEVRELTEAVVHTELPEEELAELGGLLRELTGRLASARREAPPVSAGSAGAGILRQLANPVTGALNPIAPPCDAELLPDGSVRAEFTLSAVYEGPPGLVHGGVSAMILDQILGMAAHGAGAPGLTATLELRYRRPTPLDEPLVAEAGIDRVEGRKSFATGRILDAEGRVTIEATAMFIMPLL